MLKGKVKQLHAGKLTLQTDYAGNLKLSRDDISRLDIDTPVTITLQQRGELQGRVISTENGELQLVSDSAPAIDFKFSQLASLRPVGASPTQDAAKEDGPWSGRIQAGIDGSSGNSDNQKIDVRVNVKRETENDRLSFETLLHKASQDDVQTEDEIRALARWEHDYSKRAFVFAEAEAERDQFEDVDVRYRFTLGPGYWLIQEPDHELKTRLGLGFEQERFEDGNTNNNFVLTLGYDYRVDLWEWFRLTHEFTAIPDIGDDPGKNYRLESLLGGELPLGSKDSRWRLRGELRHEYDNNPEPQIEELDTNYILSILRDFG